MTTILLVESDQASLRSLRRLLEKAGYGVCAATSPEEACRLAREQPCALALVDLSAPGVPGIAVCLSLLDRAPTAVLALSTGAVPGEQAAALAAGARACLLKPVPPDRLLASLSSLCADEKRPTSPGSDDMGQLQIAP